MAVFFWNLVKCNFFSEGYAYTGQVTFYKVPETKKQQGQGFYLFLLHIFSFEEGEKGMSEQEEEEVEEDIFDDTSIFRVREAVEKGSHWVLYYSVMQSAGKSLKIDTFREG